MSPGASTFGGATAFCQFPPNICYAHRSRGNGSRPNFPACARALPASRLAKFEAGGGILYVRNFLDKTHFEAVRKEAGKLKSSATKETNSIATKRTGVQLSKKSKCSIVFSSEEVVKNLRAMIEEDSLIPSDYPAELRYYEAGAEMGWHQDDQLHTQPTFEAVYTIVNESDSETEWIDRSDRIHSQWTEPNSLILVRSCSALHRVTKLRRGERTILKYVYTTTLERSEDYERCAKSFKS